MHRTTSLSSYYIVVPAVLASCSSAKFYHYAILRQQTKGWGSHRCMPIIIVNAQFTCKCKLWNSMCSKVTS